MLYNLQPDRSVTGGAWYSDQDFESEFVEVLNQQCFKFLQSKVWKQWCDIISDITSTLRSGSHSSLIWLIILTCRGQYRHSVKVTQTGSTQPDPTIRCPSINVRHASCPVARQSNTSPTLQVNDHVV